MPIHFSIGFVADQRPRKPFESVCAVADDVDIVVGVACNIQAVSGIANNVQRVTVVWPRDLGECK